MFPSVGYSPSRTVNREDIKMMCYEFGWDYSDVTGGDIFQYESRPCYYCDKGDKCWFQITYNGMEHEVYKFHKNNRCEYEYRLVKRSV